MEYFKISFLFELYFALSHIHHLKSVAYITPTYQYDNFIISLNKQKSVTNEERYEEYISIGIKLQFLMISFDIANKYNKISSHFMRL